jgi:predicted AAA+ superfamily ATPase
MRVTHSAPWKPRQEDYTRVLDEQNPWHRTGSVPIEWARQTERPLAKSLWRRLTSNNPKRYQIILGPRRVGKTTSLYQTARTLLNVGIEKERIWSLRVDHPLLLQIPLDALVDVAIKYSRATPERPAFIFFDELVYAKDWDLWLKTFFDQNYPIVIAASSSSTAAMRHRHLESGVGRWEEQFLAPYLFGEYLSLVDQPVGLRAEAHLDQSLSASMVSGIDLSAVANLRRKFLLQGGFPEILASAGTPNDDESILLQSQKLLRVDAVERAIYKDIPQAFGVDNPMLLERLLYTLAGQLSGILSPHNICTDLDGMAQPTFSRYLSYLERSFLVFTLENYSAKESAKQRRGKKLYFVDGAVRNAALQRGLAPLSDSTEMGLLIENLAASHVHALSLQSQVKTYYWRDGGDEVDLIYDDVDHPLAFEISVAGNHRRAGLRALISRHKKFHGKCYIVAQQTIPISPMDSPDGIGVIPLDMFLLAVSAQTEAALQARLSSASEPYPPVSPVTLLSSKESIRPPDLAEKSEPQLPGLDIPRSEI